MFTLATGTLEDESDGAMVGMVGALGADVVVEAILNAVRNATGLPGLPSVSELGGGR